MVKGVSRDRRREAQWRRIVQQHSRSGLSIREFCRRGKLKETAFYFWRSELQRRQAEQEQRRPRSRAPQSPGASAASAFVAVRLAANTAQPVTHEVRAEAPGRIEIELAGGRRIHVTAPVDRSALADVVAVLELQSC